MSLESRGRGAEDVVEGAGPEAPTCDVPARLADEPPFCVPLCCVLGTVCEPLIMEADAPFVCGWDAILLCVGTLLWWSSAH